MSSQVVDGSFVFTAVGSPFLVSEVLEADSKNLDASLYVSLKFHGSGATVVLESIPLGAREMLSGIGVSYSDQWTTVATYTTDQTRAAVAITRTLAYRYRVTVAGSANSYVSYRLAMEDASLGANTTVDSLA